MEQTSLAEKRIAVVGVGGVGGYLATMLAGACPHVTVVARGDRGAAIAANGLILHSQHKGERTARPERILPDARALGTQDIVFVCVKNHSLEEVCQALNESRAIGARTAIVPVMNGVDPAQRARAALRGGIVVPSLIYIVAFAAPDYSIVEQGADIKVRVGPADESRESLSAAQVACDLLSYADVDCMVADDIQCEVWKKYINNCALNVTTACYDAPVGEIRSDPERAQVYEALVREACAVARAKSIAIPEDLEATMLHRFYVDLGPNVTSSLQRDIDDGKPTEVETFSGHLVRQAEQLGVPVPVSAQMYRALKARIAR